MTTPLPPKGTRLRFWAFGMRVEPQYRPWVAQQITSPDYSRRRLWAVLCLQTALVVLPQGLLALAEHSRWRLVLVGALAVFLLGNATRQVVRPRPLNASTRRRLLAYHGVTADGELATPVSPWSGNPLGKTGLALLCAQVLVLSSGVAVAADRISARRACHELPAVDAAALAAVVGRPVIEGVGEPAPLVREGTPLVAARKVDSSLYGVHYVAAYVPLPSGRLAGPAVWRLIDASVYLNPTGRPEVSAWNDLARQVTPSTGYGFNSQQDAAVKTARSCAKAAR